MKKFAISLMLGALMLSALAGCGKKEEVAPKNDNNTVVESENKVDATETEASVSPTESAESNAVTTDVVATDVATTGMTTVVGGDEMATSIHNYVDDSTISIETDENGNIVNYDDIVNPYRDAIAERLSKDLTDIKSKSTLISEYVEYIDIDINSVSDDDALLFENCNSINIFDDYESDGFYFTNESISGAVYSKFYLATLYKILEKYDVSKDAITSFDSYGLNNGGNSFMCSLDSDVITEVIGTSSGTRELEDGYYEFLIEVQHADGSSAAYVTIVPVVFRMR